MNLFEPYQHYLFLYHIVWQIIASGLAFLFYAWDKRQARLDRWRVPEIRLHLLAISGGWPGAYFGQEKLRHKTQKPIFRIIVYAAGLLHLGILAWLISLAF